jgi:hypothetical protein
MDQTPQALQGKQGKLHHLHFYTRKTSPGKIKLQTLFTSTQNYLWNEQG